LGKGPSRKPLWQTERPTISGSAEDQWRSVARC
jgi:hypothetical protein